MQKRSTYEVEKRILYKIAEGRVKYSDIQLSTNTNYDTVKMHCAKFEDFGFIEIKKNAKDDANGRPSYEVSLTSLGRSVIKRLKNRES
jgi:predicted transcriptional regulator